MPYEPPRHRPPRIEAPKHHPRRESAAARGYGRRWERLARLFKRRNPRCADPFGLHDGRPVPGEHVDHIVPRSAGGSDEWSNLQTLCASCHSRKTVLCDGGFGRAQTPPGGDEYLELFNEDHAGPRHACIRGFCHGGVIELTPGNVIDYEVIRRRINELNGRFRIREVAIDRWNATQLAQQLQGDGFEVVTFGQGFRDMSAPTKEWEKLVMSGKLGHGGHPLLRWMASNVAVETDAAGNLKPSKKKSTERIDGIVAGIMALGRATLRQEQRSVYETRGLLTI